jgi:hypothetical protein
MECVECGAETELREYVHKENVDGVIVYDN